MKGGRKMKKSNLRLLTMMLVLAMSLTQLAFAEEDEVVTVSGEGIEEALVDQSPYFEQCVLYNNQDPYTVALVVPNKLAVNSYLKNNNIDPFSEQGRHEGLQLLNNEINQYRSGGKYENMFPERWLPAATAVLPEEFSEENKLINSTMKVVRGKVIEYFRDDLEHLYTPQGKDFFNEKNKSNISRFIVG